MRVARERRTAQEQLEIHCLERERALEEKEAAVDEEAATARLDAKLQETEQLWQSFQERNATFEEL